MDRHTRIQGLIVNDDHVLLIRVKVNSTKKEFWVIPGGGIEASETEVACIIREIKEETNLDVKVDQLLYIDTLPPGEGYKLVKTYLCTPTSEEASPGYEPEDTVDATITEVRWFDLRDESSWDNDLRKDPFSYPTLVNLRQTLGYET